MKNNLLLDFIFSGEFGLIDLSFIIFLLNDYREIRFDYPEISTDFKFENIIKVLNSNDYVDLAISIDGLFMEDINIKDVFVNLGLNNSKIELLLFFDITDVELESISTKERLFFLKTWAVKFNEKYNFNYFVCKMDNGNENEYFFDSHGIGSLLV